MVTGLLRAMNALLHIYLQEGLEERRAPVLKLVRATPPLEHWPRIGSPPSARHPSADGWRVAFLPKMYE